MSSVSVRVSCFYHADIFLPISYQHGISAIRMPHYTKLWSMIIESTLWREPNDLIVLWIAILAKKDRNHVVYSTIPALASAAKITNEKCAEYIKQLESPDKWSATQDDDGRRLRRVEGGWLVINGAKYQNFLRSEQTKAAKAKAQRDYYARSKNKEGAK
jgi:hypothetical protein